MPGFGSATWVVLDWMIRHIEGIDAQRLVERTKETGDLSVLGVLCDAAHERRPHLKFERIIGACVTHPGDPAPFFHRVARSPLASRLTRENALDLFLRWNYLSNELRYL